MRLLCNENIPALLIRALTGAGHDVSAVGFERPGIDDQGVLAWAKAENRVCLTFDKDFGELAANEPSDAMAGVILLRIPVLPSGDWVGRIAEIVSSRDDWHGHFTVVEPGRIRMRRLKRSD